MEPKFEAKSYTPDSLTSQNSNIEIVGGRKYSLQKDSDDTTHAKLYFIKTNDTGLSKLKQTLENGERDHVKAWRNQLCSIHSLDLLKPEEKMMGLGDDWAEGVVEIVLHPIEDEYDSMIQHFFELSKISKYNVKISHYKDSLTFISAKCTRDQLNNLNSFNPLRAIHPLGTVDITPVRNNLPGSIPKVKQSNKKSIIKVGVFDGGIHNGINLLGHHVKGYDCVTVPATENLLNHGTGVCSAILHGNLAGKTENDILEDPCVAIDSFRVLPLTNNYDFELYEAIDAIENTVRSNKDIKLYNISFGPQGAIIDDTINRFTYVLDKLAFDVSEDEHNPLFCVAVGNDGTLCAPLNRIQSPSDLVNGLGIGAYTYENSGNKIRAKYSCIGKGREGAKIKPDLLDFGGSQERPFILASSDNASLASSAGTSFSTPLTVHKIGKLMAQSSQISPQFGRILMIHNAEINENISQEEQGYGFATEDTHDIINCDDNHVTILYSGVIQPTKTIKLPIFCPNINTTKGYVSIKWTIGTVVNPNVNDPDAYTNNCLEDTFYPHELTFCFRKEGFKDFKLNLLKAESYEKMGTLLSNGYSKSDLPVSKPSKKSWAETELRSNDFKWDTVIKKNVNMHGKSLLNPFVTIHAIGRNGYVDENIRYYAAISINANNYRGSLYNEILQTYRNLAPIEIRQTNRIMVDIR
jgi:hypothetical protein